MPHQVQAVAALATGVPGQLPRIDVADPGPGKAVDQTQECEVCSTDLHHQDGSEDLPFPLDHQASGIVDPVSPSLSSVTHGDSVILSPCAVRGDRCARTRGGPRGDCLSSRDFSTLVDHDETGCDLTAARALCSVVTS